MHQARRIFGVILTAAALSGGLAAPAGAKPAVRAHIALGCMPASSHHHGHHSRQANARCFSGRLGHGLLAHAA
jgi:hypothetical protein